MLALMLALVGLLMLALMLALVLLGVFLESTASCSHFTIFKISPMKGQYCTCRELLRIGIIDIIDIYIFIIYQFYDIQLYGI
jgi:hypothetical protein